MVSRPLQSIWLALAILSSSKLVLVGVDEPEIGNVNEGIVERGEDTGNAKDELAIAGRGAQGDVLLGSTGDLLGRHIDELGVWFLVGRCGLQEKGRVKNRRCRDVAKLVLVGGWAASLRAVGRGRIIARKVMGQFDLVIVVVGGGW
jgi:hypothetical protein